MVRSSGYQVSPPFACACQMRTDERMKRYSYWKSRPASELRAYKDAVSDRIAELEALYRALISFEIAKLQDSLR